MGLTIDLEKPIDLDMGIALGRRQRAVSEELLDGSKIGATLQQVSRESMSDRVRVNTCSERSVLNTAIKNTSNRPDTQATSSIIQKYGFIFPSVPLPSTIPRG